MTSGLCEGTGLLVAVGFLPPPVYAGLTTVLAVLLVLRLRSWRTYRKVLNTSAPDEALQVIKRMSTPISLLGHLLPIILIASGYIFVGAAPVVGVLAGICALVAGWWMKYMLVTKASYNQGYAINHTPERGAGGGGAGGKPGWGNA